MKTKHLLSFLLPAVFLMASCSKSLSVSEINTIDQLKAEFADPSAQYRTMPFLVWNDDVTKEKIDHMLEGIKANGMGGGFIHPRAGMITEYFSDDWWDLFKYTVEKGKQMGLEIWLYDEDGFPSGFAGGHVQADFPSSYQEGHSVGMIRQDVLKLDSSELYRVILKKEGDAYTDITASAVSMEGQSGDFYLFNKLSIAPSPRWGNFPYVNLLMPGVVDYFLDFTFSGYQKNIGSEFGKVVPGIFTDEPHIRPETGATWFTDLFPRFEQRWGYKLETSLPSLFTEAGDWQRIRYEYRRLLLEVELERWAEPYRHWCDSLGLQWTGHYWEHAWPQPQTAPEYMILQSYSHIPGIDILFNQYDENGPQFGNIRSVREVRSVGNQMGANRTVCEVYAGSGWEFSFFDMKRQSDWLHTLGVNMINQHYTPTSIKGVRKTDYPEVFSYQEPWWPYYKTLGDYQARLSVAMSSGVQVNDILVLEPTTSVWMYYIRGYNAVGNKTGEIARPFQELVTLLETNQVEYDLGSEPIMRKYGEVKGSSLAVGQRDYSTVVVPSTMESIDRSTFDLLKQFADKGGKVIVLSPGPQYLEGAQSEEVVSFFAGDRVTRLDAVDKAALAEHFLIPDKIKFADNVADIPRLFHQRRVMNDGQLLLLSNASDVNRLTGQVTVKGADALLFNPMTGLVTDYPETAAADGMITVDYDLYPAGDLLLYIADKKQKGYDPTPFYNDMKPVETASAVTASPDGDNVLVIDHLDLTIEGKTTRDMYYYNADNETYRTYGFQGGNPWFFSAMYKRTFLDHEFPETSGFTAAYHFNVSQPVDFSKMKLVVERGNDWTVKVNGTEVKAIPGKWWIDWDFKMFDISGCVRQGENTVELSVSPMTIHSETMAVYVLGDFSVDAGPRNWTIGAPKPLGTGSWKAQGMPFYGQTVTYAKTFTVGEPASHYEVELGDWNGTVAEVIVNGSSAGIIGWPPFRADVTQHIQPGENKVEVRVVGSLKNTLGSFYAKARGQVSPALMKRGSDGIPAPAEFDLFDYGLMGDIRLLAQ